MPDDIDLPRDYPASEFFAKYIASCARLGVTPVGAERAAGLVCEWTDALNRIVEPTEKSD